MRFSIAFIINKIKGILATIGLCAITICSLTAQDVNVKSKNNKEGKVFKEGAISIPINHYPLYIIDGVLQPEKNPLKGLTTDSIKDIKILKDKATALYGARGSYGVIIITTKSEKVKND